MNKKVLKTWKLDLNSFSKVAVASTDLQTLTSKITKAYIVSQAILDNCIEKQKSKRAVKLRKHLLRYLNNCHFIKEDLIQENKQKTQNDLNAYKDVMAGFLSYYIDVTILSSDLKEKGKLSTITSSLFFLLGFKEERVVNALLGSMLPIEEHASIFSPVYKRVMEEPIPKITCSHYIKLSLLVKKEKSAMTNDGQKYKTKKVFSRYEFPTGMEYFLRNQLGSAFPLELPVEQKELKKFLLKLDDKSANILQKKLCQRSSKKLNKLTLVDKKPKAEIPNSKGLRNNVYFIDVNKIITKTTDEDDKEDQKEKEEEDEDKDDEKNVHKNLDALIKETELEVEEPNKFDEKLCKVSLEEFVREPLDDGVGKSSTANSLDYSLEDEENQIDDKDNELDDEDNESVASVGTLLSSVPDSEIEESETKSSEKEEEEETSDENVTNNAVNSEEDEDILEEHRTEGDVLPSDEYEGTSEEDENEAEEDENEAEEDENEAEEDENGAEEDENEAEEDENEAEEDENEAKEDENEAEDVVSSEEDVEMLEPEEEGKEAKSGKNSEEDDLTVAEKDLTSAEDEDGEENETEGVIGMQGDIDVAEDVVNLEEDDIETPEADEKETASALKEYKNQMEDVITLDDDDKEETPEDATNYSEDANAPENGEKESEIIIIEDSDEDEENVTIQKYVKLEIVEEMVKETEAVEKPSPKQDISNASSVKTPSRSPGNKNVSQKQNRGGNRIAEVSSTTYVINDELSNSDKPDLDEDELADKTALSSHEKSFLRTPQNSEVRTTPSHSSNERSIFKTPTCSSVERSVRRNSKRLESPVNEQKAKKSERKDTDSKSSPEKSSARKRSSRFVTPNSSLLMDYSETESPENVFVTPDTAKESIKRRKLQKAKKRKESLETKSGSTKKVSPKFTYSKSSRTSDVRRSKRSEGLNVSEESPEHDNKLQPVVKLKKLLVEGYKMVEGNDSLTKNEHEASKEVNPLVKRSTRAANGIVPKTPKRYHEVPDTPKRRTRSSKVPDNLKRSCKDRDTPKTLKSSSKVPDTQKRSSKDPDTPKTLKSSSKVPDTPKTLKRSGEVRDTPKRSCKVPDTPKTLKGSSKVPDTPKTLKRSGEVPDTPKRSCEDPDTPIAPKRSLRTSVQEPKHYSLRCAN